VALPDVPCPAPGARLDLGPIEVSGRHVDQLILVALLACLALTLWLYRRPRKAEQTSLVFVSLSALALAAVGLGMAAYAQGANDSTTVLGPMGWVLGLFLGELYPDHLCGTPYPVGFESAQVLAVVATGSTFLTLVGSRWQAQWTRLRIRFASDLDVVIGLDEWTMPLVEALVTEAKRDGRGSRIVVVPDGASDVLVSRARSAGADVWDTDPRLPFTQRRLVLQPLITGNRVSLRRMFILGRDQFANNEIYEAACHELRAAEPQSHVRDVVPRIVVRMDDPKEASEWRLAHVGDPGETAPVDTAVINHTKPVRWFADALSQYEVMAHNLAALVGKREKKLLVLVGDSPLVVALLTELARRRWARKVNEQLNGEFEVEFGADKDEDFRTGLKEARDEPALKDIILVSASASGLGDEWAQTRPPLTAPHGDEGPVVPQCHQLVKRDSGEVFVKVDDDAPQVALYRYLRDLDALVILAEDGVPAYAREVLRASRTASGDLVVAVPDSDVPTVDGQLVEGGAIRYGPSSLMSGVVLEDSWGGLARARHAAYLQRWVSHPLHETHLPWTLAGEEEELGTDYQSDNLRQLRHVLECVEGRGYTWHPVTSDSDVRGSGVSEDHVRAIARCEHERWRRLREVRGWSFGERDDAKKRSAMLKHWDDLDADAHDRNVGDVRDILESLRAYGLAPKLDDKQYTHERFGEVTAERRDLAWNWTTAQGEQVLQQAGDWWVVSEGQGNGVAAEAFARLYEHVDGDRYARSGPIRARKGVPQGEWITSLELKAQRADEGSMVVFDGHSTWPVPRAKFEAQHRKRANAPKVEAFPNIRPPKETPTAPQSP